MTQRYAALKALESGLIYQFSDVVDKFCEILGEPRCKRLQQNCSRQLTLHWRDKMGFAENTRTNPYLGRGEWTITQRGIDYLNENP